MKAKNNPEMSFAEKLKNARNLKVEYKGEFHQIPNTILNQGRHFALRSVGVNYDIFSEKNPSISKDTDAQIQEAFEDFLEGYLESIMPLKNPSTARASKVFETVYEFFNDKNRTLEKWYKNPRDEIEAKRLLRSAVMKIAQVYLDGALDIRTKEEADLIERELELKNQYERGQLTEEEFKNQKLWFGAQGRAKTVFRPGDSPSNVRMVVYYRTLRNVISLAIAAVIAKILKTNPNQFKNAVGTLIKNLDKNELEGTNLKEVLLIPLYEKISNQTSDINIIQAIQSTNLNTKAIKPSKNKKAAQETASTNETEALNKSG